MSKLNRNRFLPLFFATVVLLSAAGCTDTPKEEKSSSAPSASAAPTASPKASAKASAKPSAKPAEKPTEKPGAKPTEEATSSQIIEESASSGLTNQEEMPGEALIPKIEEGSQEFQEQFAGNPIDAKLEEDSLTAGSHSAMKRAGDTAAKSWKAMVDIAFDAAKQATPQEDQEALEGEQEEWTASMEAQLETLQAAAQDGPDAAVKSTLELVTLYRERAAALCWTAFEETGTMPDFSQAMSSGGPVG